MEAIVGSLRRLDRDADELIDAGEVSLISAPVATPMMQGRPTLDSSVPTVLELSPGESPVRLARLLIKKYDTRSSRGPGRRDSRLSPEEFAIPAESFAETDRNHDGTLNAEELRAYLAQAPRDAILDVALSPDGSGRATAVVRGGDGGSPSGMTVRQLSDGVVEMDMGLIRLDIHVDDGASSAETARKALRARFDSADANQDGYLEMDELSQDNGQPSPLAGLFKALDRDGDGKLYPRELDEFVAQQAVAARGRVTMTASDEGRALFGMLDMDRDRRLGAREVLDTFARVSACDRDRDGRVTPDEIPHHIRLSLDRGDLSVLLTPPASGNVVVVSTGADLRAGTSEAGCRPELVSQDGSQPRRRRLPARVPRDPRAVRSPRPRPRRPALARRGQGGVGRPSRPGQGTWRLSRRRIRSARKTISMSFSRRASSSTGIGDGAQLEELRLGLLAGLGTEVAELLDEQAGTILQPRVDPMRDHGRHPHELLGGREDVEEHDLVDRLARQVGHDDQALRLEEDRRVLVEVRLDDLGTHPLGPQAAGVGVAGDLAEGRVRGRKGCERVSLIGGPSITAFLSVSAARRAAVVMKRLPSSVIR